MKKTDLLIPVKRTRVLTGTFTWPKLAALLPAEKDDRLPLGQLRADLVAAGLQSRLGGAPDNPAVRIVRGEETGGPEAYRLTIKPDGIEIVSSSAAGAYYAVQTLRELLAIHGRRIPAMRIDDWPDFPRRGVYHDCSRGKVPTVKTICRLVERLARWKINELQLYIENVFQYRKHPAIGAGYSPYGAEDILAIQACCKAHHVRFVGSLASFGHLEKVLELPEYRHLAEVSELDARSDRGDLCPTDPASIEFLADLYGEFLPLLEAEDFNACCDETSQIGTGRSKELAEKVGVGRLYLDFVLKIHKLCQRHGKRLNIWGDIILAHPELIGDIPKDIVMLNWDYDADGRRIDRTDEFADAGLPLVCCPGTNGWQSHGTRMDQANANVAKFARIGRKYHAEGLLNTDWGDCGHRNTLGVSLHSFAHGAAHSWHGRGVDEKTFTRTFAFHVFGDKTGKLAAALKTLGAWPTSSLYHALVEPLVTESAFGHRMIGHRAIDRVAAKDLRKRVEEMKKLRFPTIAGLDDFEQTAMEEFDLARRMDLLAARRALAAQDLRAGKEPSPAALRQLADEMKDVAADFARLWRRRSRPSRLADNLAAMKATVAEARKLARQQFAGRVPTGHAGSAPSLPRAGKQRLHALQAVEARGSDWGRIGHPLGASARYTEGEVDRRVRHDRKGPPARPGGRIGGFTLVELLVSIAIIGVLVAMMMPSLGRARGLTRSAVCRSNLHQLWTTLHAGEGLSLPDSDAWIGFVYDREAGDVTRCPEDDRDIGPGGSSLEDYYLYHYHLLEEHIYAPITEAIAPDAPLGKGVFIQMKAERPKPGVTEIYLEGGGAFRVIEGSPAIIEGIYTFDMGVYRPWGASEHWIVERVGGGFQKRMHLLGTDNLNGPIEPERLTLGGARASYGMNNQVRPIGPSPGQLMLLDYRRVVADVDGQGASDDILSQTLAPRHLGQSNVLTVGGSCQLLWPWELQSDAPLWKAAK